MKTIHFREKTDAGGTLHLPIGEADAECEVVVTVQPMTPVQGWLPGFWEKLIENSQGEPWFRSDQEVAERRDTFQIRRE